MRPINSLMDLSTRKALVTGGAGHIGQAVSEALVELGATVSILDQDASACEKRVKELSRLRPDSALALPCNLADEQGTREAARHATQTMGGLDILIHLAAYVGTTQAPGWTVPFEQQSVATWDAAMRVNLTSAFILAQETRDALAESGHGSIIFFGSTYGLVGQVLSLYEGTDMVNPSAYAASKGGLIQFTRHLATTLAPQIRVNAISPGGVWRDQPESFHKRYVARTPLQRMASEEDMKGAVAYLASDLSAYVTGQNLSVDGGWTTW